jgi:hypothetical protein
MFNSSTKGGRGESPEQESQRFDNLLKGIFIVWLLLTAIGLLASLTGCMRPHQPVVPGQVEYIVDITPTPECVQWIRKCLKPECKITIRYRKACERLIPKPEDE